MSNQGKGYLHRNQWSALPKIEVTCSYCSKTFFVNNSRKKRKNKHFFCCKPCEIKWNTGKTYSERFGIETAIKLLKIRSDCMSKLRKLGIVNNAGCSQPWLSERNRQWGKEGRFKGEKSGNWRGGTTPEDLKRLLSYEWQQIRKQIYVRDNWSCQKCGKHGGRLSCHHLIPWRISKNDSPDNLITLCAQCHGREEDKLKREAFLL